VFGSVSDVWKSSVVKFWGSKLRFLSSPPSRESDFDVCFGSSHPSGFSWVDKLSSHLPIVLYMLGDAEEYSLPVGFTQCVIKHAFVGGVTDHVATFYFRNLESISITPSLPQQLGSIIDYSAFVGRLREGDHLDIHNDLLPISKPKSLIRVPSFFGSGTIGSRTLTIRELCAAWNIPRGLFPNLESPNVSWIDGLVPCNSILAVSDTVCSLIDIPSVRVGLPTLAPLGVATVDPKGTLLPGLNRYLSRDWINKSLITDESKKTDDARIPVELWDFRTCQPLGVDYKDAWVQRSLGILRRLFLDRLKPNVILSFVDYMSRRYEAQ